MPSQSPLLRSGRRFFRNRLFHFQPLSSPNSLHHLFCSPSPPPSVLCLYSCSLVSFLSFSPTCLSRPPLRAAPQRRPPVRSLGSAGSETVTQSSLVIGHGHANQTGRNLQLIRILPPAIIVPSRLNPPPREN